MTLRTSQDYDVSYSDCDCCLTRQKTRHTSYDDTARKKGYSYICKECEDQMPNILELERLRQKMKLEEELEAAKEALNKKYTDKYKEIKKTYNHRVAALLHFCTTLAWGPLCWVVSHKIVHDPETYSDMAVFNWGRALLENIPQVWWGVAMTGIMMNLYCLFYRLFMARLINANLFWYRPGDYEDKAES